MKQMTLFEVMNDTKPQEHNSDPVDEGITELQKMTPCVFCNVIPIVRHRIVEHHGYNVAKCPVCGWQCGTPYDITEHWNKLNTLNFRLSEKSGKGNNHGNHGKGTD